MPVSDDGPPDVFVKLGAVPDAPAGGFGPFPVAGGLLIVVDEVGRYFVRNGSEVVVSPQPNAAKRDMRLFLLGSAMGALLHQRGLLPLHANSVEIGGKAFAFMGPSGSGKSTLAAWFHDRGHRVVSDDVSVVDFSEDDMPLVQPGFPRLRLWRDVLDATGRNVDSYQLSFRVQANRDKYDVPVDLRSRSLEAVPLAAIYQLGSSAELDISPLTGVAAAGAIFANTYRGSYIPLTADPLTHWTTCLRLVKRTPVYSANRLWDLEQMDSQCRGLLLHAERTSSKHEP